MDHSALFDAQYAIYKACRSSYESPDSFEEDVKKAVTEIRKVVIQDIPLVRETMMVRIERLERLLLSLYAIQIACPTNDMSLPEAPCFIS